MKYGELFTDNMKKVRKQFRFCLRTFPCLSYEIVSELTH